MEGEKLEKWQQLCAQAAKEQDSHRLMELVKEIVRLLEEKQERLRNNGNKRSEAGVP